MLAADTCFIMSSTTAVVLLIAVVSGAVAAAEKTKRPATPPSPVSQRQAALEHLLAERESPAALQAAIAQARQQDISEQVILEARFLFLVDRHDDAGIAALLPEFTKRRETFKVEESEIFATKEDWLAVNEYVDAIAALRQGDKLAFKQHITEAFWLSPRQGVAFAPHIDRLRLDEAMRSIKIDFAEEFTTINSVERKSLKNFMGDNQALLLHFWSPWSNESEASMPDFIRTAKVLSSNKICIVSMLVDDTPDLLVDARASLKGIGGNPPGAWLVDEKSHSIKRLLRVQTLPAMVLIASDGRVLCNGHPTADELWNALQKINPQIRRPALADAVHTP